MKATRVIGDDAARFASKVDASGGPDACHPWTAGTNKDGYGQFSSAGKPYLAHRWLLGHLRDHPLRPDEHGLHHCDNPPCVNPRHLYIGDHAQNMRDREERGRGRWGTSSSHRKCCLKGHPYDEANTYHTPKGSRMCRECNRAAQRRCRSRRKFAA